MAARSRAKAQFAGHAAIGPTALATTSGSDLWSLFFGTPTTTTAPAIPYVSVAKAAATQAAADTTSFGVADTASHLLSALPQLSQYSHLASLRVIDTAQLHISFATFSTYRPTLDKLVPGESLALAGLTMAQAALAQADAVVGGFTVTETAAHLLAGLETLNGYSHLTAVNLAEPGPLALSYSRWLADAAVVAKLPAGALLLGGVTAAGAAAVAQDAHVAHFQVSDTLANIGLNLDALATAARAGNLTGITVSDSGHTLDLSPGRAQADQAALALLSGDFHLTQSAPAFTINLVYGASMANAPAGMKAALAEAVQYFEGLFTSAASITLKVGYGEFNGTALGRGVLGEGNPASGVTVSYADYKAAFAAHATTAAQQQALTHMAAQGADLYVPAAEAKVLGLLDPYAGGIDGVLAFASDARGTLWNFDTTHRGITGLYDFLGLAEHEISHALGRIAGLDVVGSPTPLDLTRYSAPGVAALLAATPAYFSLDGGATNLNWYATLGDPGDWAASAGADANDAVVPRSVANLFSQVDVVQMNALGYALG